jgi:hypothetical protein
MINGDKEFTLLIMVIITGFLKINVGVQFKDDKSVSQVDTTKHFQK